VLREQDAEPLYLSARQVLQLRHVYLRRVLPKGLRELTRVRELLRK